MSWLLDAFELFMLNVSCNSHCFLALCCALHRITSRVIHRTELYFFYCFMYIHSIHIQWQTTMICWMERFKQQRSYRYMIWFVIYIMVRHNHINRYDCAKLKVLLFDWWFIDQKQNVNDPYAGSPTKTLLRLLLPLNDQAWASSLDLDPCLRTDRAQSDDLAKPFNR